MSEEVRTEAVIAALEECEGQLDQLKRENRLLRDASRTFGALAERLNASLESERRANHDRRARSRQSPDRRQAGTVGDRRANEFATNTDD